MLDFTLEQTEVGVHTKVSAALTSMAEIRATATTA